MRLVLSEQGADLDKVIKNLEAAGIEAEEGSKDAEPGGDDLAPPGSETSLITRINSASKDLEGIGLHGPYDKTGDKIRKLSGDEKGFTKVDLADISKDLADPGSPASVERIKIARDKLREQEQNQARIEREQMAAAREADIPTPD